MNARLLSIEQVTHTLRHRVLTGYWQPGQRIDTEKQLAEEFGVSPATVQRAMRDLERAGFIHGRRGSGRYVRAQQVGSSANDLTLVIAQSDHMFHRASIELGRGVSQVAARHGYHLKYWAIHTDAHGFKASDSPAWIQLLQQAASHTAGLIVATQRVDREALYQASQMLPVVWLHPISHPPRLCSIVLDYLGAAFQLGQHVRELGHRRVALITTAHNDMLAQFQADGVRLALHDLLTAKQASLDILRGEDFTQRQGQALAKQWLQQPAEQRATAVVGGADELAKGFAQVILEAGLRIPQDVSLTGWNDFLPLDDLPVALTSIRLGHEQVGRRSAQCLIDMLQTGKPGPVEPERIPCELVVRQSTARPQTSATAALTAGPIGS